MTILDVNKTKKVVDFRRARKKPDTTSILVEKVELVQDLRCLGVRIDSRLNCNCNTEAVYKKRQSRLYFSSTLRSFAARG